MGSVPSCSAKVYFVLELSAHCIGPRAPRRSHPWRRLIRDATRKFRLIGRDSSALSDATRRPDSSSWWPGPQAASRLFQFPGGIFCEPRCSVTLPVTILSRTRTPHDPHPLPFRPVPPLCWAPLPPLARDPIVRPVLISAPLRRGVLAAFGVVRAPLRIRNAICDAPRHYQTLLLAVTRGSCTTSLPRPARRAATSCPRAQ